MSEKPIVGRRGKRAAHAEFAIHIEHVSKVFTLQTNRVSGLKARVIGAFHPRWRPRSEAFEALADVSIAVRRGEAVALMGHNGSGKSTLLQLMAGILQPTSGRIAVRGRVAPLIELGVGFHPELTGAENIYLNASLFGMPNRRTRKLYDAIVAFAELEKFIDSPVKNYSSGMYMRLGFAVAVHMEPDILLADEVLAVGDQSFQVKCFQRISEMRREGMTLILVTHAPDLAERFCERVIRLEHGRIVEERAIAATTRGRAPLSKVG